MRKKDVKLANALAMELKRLMDETPEIHEVVDALNDIGVEVGLHLEGEIKKEPSSKKKKARASKMAMSLKKARALAHSKPKCPMCAETQLLSSLKKKDKPGEGEHEAVTGNSLEMRCPNEKCGFGQSFEVET